MSVNASNSTVHRLRRCDCRCYKEVETRPLQRLIELIHHFVRRSMNIVGSAARSAPLMKQPTTPTGAVNSRPFLWHVGPRGLLII
jgi:hypothetical protein